MPRTYLAFKVGSLVAIIPGRASWKQLGEMK